MPISTSAKVGTAAGLALVAILTGAFIIAWNRAAPPKIADDDVSTNPGTAAPAVIASRPAGTPLFTLSPETTVITAPLHDDGTPDYIAATNTLLSKGVTPQNNAFTAWLNLAGKKNLPQAVADQIISMSGATPSDDTALVSFYDYCEKHDHSDHGAASTGLDDLQKAELGPWTDSDLPILAAYLQENAAVLDAAVKAFNRPRYWLPSAANDGRSMTNVLLPGLGVDRMLAKEFLARATHRLAAHDLDGCCADLRAAGRIAALVSTGQSIIERLVAYAINVELARTLAASAAGNLSADQAAAFLQLIDHLPPTQDLHDAIVRGERWDVLDMVLRIATGHVDEVATNTSKADQRRLLSIEPDGVNWDTVLKDFNTDTDAHLNALQTPLLEEMQRAITTLEKRSNGQIPRSELRDLTPVAGETREHYTARVSAGLQITLLPSLSRAEEIRRASVMQLQMASALLALAQLHAAGKPWPASADAVPSTIALPIDIYVHGGAAHVQYILTPTGPALYSVGRNGIDDGGVRGHDDLALGAPIAPSP